MFVAFVPVLFYLDSLKEFSRTKRFLLAFTGLFTAFYLFAYFTSFNAWGDYDQDIYAYAALSAWPEALLTSFFVFFKRPLLGLIFIPFAWGTADILQTSWEISAPFLVLGHGLSTQPSIIQHYAIWGTIGGTVYILSFNVIIFLLIKKLLLKERIRKSIIAAGLMLIPIVISLITFKIEPGIEKDLRVAVAVGNFEHFTQEYAEHPEKLIAEYNKLLNTVDLKDVELVVLPESAVVNGGWIENLNKEGNPIPLDSLCPGKEIFFGSHLFSVYHGDDKKAYNVRFDPNNNLHYLSHNCIVFRNKDNVYQVRSKDKYVPFHERIPYPSILMFTKTWLIRDAVPTFIAAYSGSVQGAFKAHNHTLINPLMCFESAFSDMAIKNNDADFTLILANESWNNEKRGKEQYFDYTITKAIESGKEILKVSNSGYTALISPKGKVSHYTGYEKPTVQIINVPMNSSASLYSRIHGLITFMVIGAAITLLITNLFSTTNTTKS